MLGRHHTYTVGRHFIEHLICVMCRYTEASWEKAAFVGGDRCGSHELMSKTWRNALLASGSQFQTKKLRFGAA
jgi:hypothetical protein